MPQPLPADTAWYNYLMNISGAGLTSRGESLRRIVASVRKAIHEGVAMNWLFRILRFRGDARAARRGPRAMAGRAGRRGISRLLRRFLR